MSGGSERDRWVDGVRVGHIVDPRVGRPVDSTSSVIVWHRQALVADMLSTALYVMGEDAGLVWAARHDVAACFISPPRVGASPDGDVTLRASRAFRRQFALP